VSEPPPNRDRKKTNHREKRPVDGVAHDRNPHPTGRPG
jgi:hypothetical protein